MAGCLHGASNRMGSESLSRRQATSISALQLGIDGYHLYNDITKTITDATSPDGLTTVSWMPVVPRVVKPDPPCGYSTGRSAFDCCFVELVGE